MGACGLDRKGTMLCRERREEEVRIGRELASRGLGEIKYAALSSNERLLAASAVGSQRSHLMVIHLPSVAAATERLL